MEIKIYKHRTDVTGLPESYQNSTEVVKLNPRDFESAPIVRTVDFEDRIVSGADTILSNAEKVLGIIELELWWQEHQDLIEVSDLVELGNDLYMKLPDRYIKVELTKQ